MKVYTLLKYNVCFAHTQHFDPIVFDVILIINVVAVSEELKKLLELLAEGSSFGRKSRTVSLGQLSD